MYRPTAAARVPRLPNSDELYRRRDLKKIGFHDDSTAAAALKMKFQKLDTSGNGTLELMEMAKLLPGWSLEDVGALFRQIDNNRSNTVSFIEFIDYIFRPSTDENDDTPQPRDSFSEFTKLRDVMDEESPGERVVGSVSFDGGRLYNAVSGDMLGQEERTYNGFPTFEWTDSARIRNTEPLMRMDKQIDAIDVAEPEARKGFVDLNYPVIFDDELNFDKRPHLHVFYSWTSDLKQVGWFIAETKPPEGEPTSKFLLFNPSMHAESPDKCCAMWQTIEGDRDKRLFGENTGLRVNIYEREVPEDPLEDEELWGEISENIDQDWQQGDYEREWEDQSGEAYIEDDFDSDAWCKQNEQRAIIGEEARRKRLEKQEAKEKRRLERHKARATEDTKTDQEAITDVKSSKQDAGKTSKRDNKGRKKISRDTGHVKHAPGFVVRKVVHEDHLAQRGSQKRLVSSGVQMEDSDGEDKDTGEQMDELDYSIYEDGKFIDDEFPPCGRTLGSRMDGVDGWTRLSNITERPCLFHRIIPEACVTQAFPGNMWLTSACAAAAEYPAWIQSMFGRQPRLSKAGRYRVRLYHPGQKRFVRVVIDDYVPTKNGSPAFAGVSGDGEIWVPLVEKAFAKLCGSYAASEWGLNAHGMHYICGGSCTATWVRLGPSRWRRSCTAWNGGADIPLDRGLSEGKVEVGDWRDEDDVWAMLRMSMERCYPVACCIDREEKNAVGLQTQCLYSIIDVREVPTDEGWNLRMVLLRNPYDCGKWEGRWSDYSDTWKENPKVRSVLEHRPNVSTTFWMSFTDFDHYFEEIDIVRKSMPVQGCNRHKLRGIKRGLVKHE